MSQLQVESRPVTPVPQAGVASRTTNKPKAPPTAEQCLVVSMCERWATKLRRAAAAHGWEPIACSSADAAARAAVRNRVSLAIVDLASAEQQHRRELQELAEMLARNNGALLMVCGNDSDAAEEIWARQLGVWAYLPAVDDDSDVAMLCGEAKSAVRQVQASGDNPW